VFRLWKVRNPDRRYDCGRVRGGEPRGHMAKYHVPVGCKEKRERWDPMTSLKATWTLMNVPHATVVKGDSCAVGPEDKVIRDFVDSRDKCIGA
jgi:hypothetical protein